MFKGFNLPTRKIEDKDTAEAINEIVRQSLAIKADNEYLLKEIELLKQQKASSIQEQNDVYEYTLPADADTLNITGLDLIKDKRYKILIDAKSSVGAGTVALYMYVNNDFDDSHYVFHYTQVVGGTFYGGSSTTPWIAYVPEEYFVPTDITLVYTQGDNGVDIHSVGNFVAHGQQMDRYSYDMNIWMTSNIALPQNVTSITFKCSSGKLTAGTTIRMWVE